MVAWGVAAASMAVVCPYTAADVADHFAEFPRLKEVSWLFKGVLGAMPKNYNHSLRLGYLLSQIIAAEFSNAKGPKHVR